MSPPLVEHTKGEAMKIKLLGIFLVITMLFATAAGLCTVVIKSERQQNNRRLTSYKHPCIVLKVDNSGCQSEIEMRTRVAVAAR
jgi:hypothetical protein